MEKRFKIIEDKFFIVHSLFMHTLIYI